MTLVGFKAKNHPQQVLFNGARDDTDERATPRAFFAKLHLQYRFTVDAAALPYNAKLDRFWTPEQDGLAQDWGGERVWCNPPFSDLGPWVAKAWSEILDDGQSTRPGGAELIVMLLPANRTEQPFWQDLIEPFRDRTVGRRVRCQFLPGRMKFGIRDMAPLPNSRSPFGCCLLVWDQAADGHSSRSISSMTAAGLR